MQVPLSPIRFLERSAKYHKDRTAVICGDHSFNYKEFLERVNRAANLFSNIGSEQSTQNDQKYPPRIVFITWNCHRVIEASFAALRAQVIRVPLNVRLTPDDWAFLINDVEAAAVVVGEEFIEQFETIRPDLSTVKSFYMMKDDPTVELSEGYDDYDHAVSEQQPSWPEGEHAVRAESEPVEIFFTSGTTGEPKGVFMSSRNLYMNAANVFMPLSLSASDIFLHSLSLFHINGWGALHFMAASAGTQVVMKKFAPEEFCSLVQKHGVTLTCMVPTMLNILSQYPKLDQYDLGSLRLIVSGGAKLPLAVGKNALEKLGCEIIGSYGLTETAPVATIAVPLWGKDDTGEAPDDITLSRKFCPGLDTLDCETKVLDENGDDIEWDGQAVGEILVRGNVVSDGYWKENEETRSAYTAGPVPWLHTGDLAVIDPDGYIHIVDRTKDIIVRGGENISSLEVEDILCRHPSVLEAAVVPRPSEKWGEEPLAVVVLKPGAEQDERALLDHCRSNLARFKVPAEVRFVDELPKSGTGKILKREIRKQFDP